MKQIFLVINVNLYQWLQTLFSIISNIYSIFIIIYLFLHTITGDRLWLVELIATFLHWFLLPTLILLPLAVWWRRRLTSFLLTINLLIFGLLFGYRFLPPLPPFTSPAITVMSYNLADGLAPPDEVVTYLRATNSDIVTLQELAENQAVVFERDLKDIYPYQQLYPFGTTGTGVLSRYPILEEQLIHLQIGVPHLQVKINMGKDEDAKPEVVTLIVAHTPPPQLTEEGYYFHPLTTVEIESLIQKTVSQSRTILLGDFNMTDQNVPYSLLTGAGLTDTFAEAGWGLGNTWGPYQFPFHLVRIDYIWTTPDFEVNRAWVGKDAGSDHLPLLAELN